MAAFGIKAIQPQDNEHILGFAVARSAGAALLEIWNGPTNSDLQYDFTAGAFHILSGNGIVVGHTAQVVAGDPASAGTAVTAEAQILGTAQADGTLVLGVHSETATIAPGITLYKSGNAAIGSYTVVTDNEDLGFIAFGADDGTDVNTTVARIRARVDDASPAASDIGGDLVFETATGTSANDLGAALTLSAAKLATFAGAVTVATTLLVTGITTHGANVVSDTDSTDDLGTTGVRWANLFVDDITITTTATAGTSLIGGTMTVAAGSLTDSSGAISFGNENLTTTGTLASGVLTVTGALLPNADNGGALGASGTGWSDLFLASGAVINFNAGNATVTHAANTLTAAVTTFAITGALTVSTTTTLTGVTTHGGNVVSDTDSTDDLGTTGVRWANLWVDAITMGGTLAGAVATFSTITGSGVLTIDDTTEATAIGTASGIFDGGVSIAKDLLLGTTSTIFVGDTANANMTAGVTINISGADNQAFDLKSSDVVTGATSIGVMNTETDDFYSVQKASATLGGVATQATAEDDSLTIVADHWAVGGTADTTKTTAGVGLMTFTAVEHNGSNARANITADGNVFAVRAYVGGSFLARLIVDEDGDIFSVSVTDVTGTGNALTATAFDNEDDPELLRTFSLAVSDPKDIVRTKHDEFLRYNESDLVRLGILGAPVADGGMWNINQNLRLVNGAVWQHEVAIKETRSRQEKLEDCLRGLVEVNPKLQGRDEALALLAA